MEKENFNVWCIQKVKYRFYRGAQLGLFRFEWKNMWFRSRRSRKTSFDVLQSTSLPWCWVTWWRTGPTGRKKEYFSCKFGGQCPVIPQKECPGTYKVCIEECPNHFFSFLDMARDPETQEKIMVSSAHWAQYPLVSNFDPRNDNFKGILLLVAQNSLFLTNKSQKQIQP